MCKVTTILWISNILQKKFLEIVVFCCFECNHCINIRTTCRQKLQKKETRRGFAGTLQVSKSLYNVGGLVTLNPLTKVIIFLHIPKSPLSFHHLINQPPNPDFSCPGDCLEFVPGVSVNCDDNLHPLVLRICRFATCSGSCSTPIVVCHDLVLRVKSNKYQFLCQWESLHPINEPMPFRESVVMSLCNDSPQCLVGIGVNSCL